MNGRGDTGDGDIVGIIIGLFVSIFLIWAFFQVLSQINIWYALLFLLAGILVIAGAVLSIFKG